MRRAKGTPEERVVARCNVGVCWTWQGAKTPDGYGKIRIDGRLVLVHRVMYEAHKGPIPEGMQIDHTCRRRHCCNPEHLEVVTSRENTLRGKGLTAKNARKKRCKRGHDLTDPENVIERQEKDGLRRRCRKCYLERKRKAYAEGRYR